MEQAYQFQNPYVRELRFDDADGIPKLILSPAVTGLNFYPALAEGGKVLLADLLKPPPPVAEQTPAPPPTTSPSPPGVPAVVEETPAAQPGPPLPLVVLDAAHGGDDIGARGRDGVVEKTLVAQIAARVRAALLDTNKYRIVLTRVGDTNRSFEQRESVCNVARPAVLLTFHAGDIGVTTPLIL